MAYDKSGRAADGSLDPKRKLVAGIMHAMNIGGGGGSLNLRKIGDDLYQTMITGEGKGGWKIKGAKGGSDDDATPTPGGIADVDYSSTGERRSVTPRVASRLASEEKKTMKEGGLVRGAGCAQRGRGRGKMV